MHALPMNQELNFINDNNIFCYERDDKTFVEYYGPEYFYATYCVDKNVVEVSYGLTKQTGVRRFIDFIRTTFNLQNPKIIDGSYSEWIKAIA